MRREQCVGVDSPPQSRRHAAEALDEELSVEVIAKERAAARRDGVHVEVAGALKALLRCHFRHHTDRVDPTLATFPYRVRAVTRTSSVVHVGVDNASEAGRGLFGPLWITPQRLDLASSDTRSFAGCDPWRLGSAACGICSSTARSFRPSSTRRT